MTVVNRVFTIAMCCSSLGEVHAWSGTSVQDLHGQYYNIFTTGNRNAASHLWSKFLIDNSYDMNHETFTHMFSGFCAVSGSPVSPQDRTRYKVALEKVTGGKQTGYMYHCCWPCTCDTKDFIKVDTKTVTTKGGDEKKYNFAVIGNPCDKPEELSKSYEDAFGRGVTTLSSQAPELICDKSGKLKGAHLSDNGYIIISMFFDEDSAVSSMEESVFEPMCTDRAKSGYASGMGTIFRKVSAVSPIAIGASNAALMNRLRKSNSTSSSHQGHSAQNETSNVALMSLRKTNSTSSSHQGHDHDHKNEHHGHPKHGSSCGATKLHLAVVLASLSAYLASSASTQIQLLRQ
jgi:hypothetical protein